MPTYDYLCGACDHTWELFQSITAEPVRKCPACGKSRARRLIGTGSSIIFRGSGFYVTDYRSESYKKAARAESEAASGTKSGSTSPGESGSGTARSEQPAAGEARAEGAGKTSGKKKSA